jgi:type IV secretion system protein VirB9
VVTVPVKRGVVTLVVLDADESITEVAAGLGGDCAKAESAWCVAAQPGGRNFFVKAKSSASAANNLAVVTDRRTHAFRFVVLADGDPKPPVYRLVVKAPPATGTCQRASRCAMTCLSSRCRGAAASAATAGRRERLQAKPQVMNTQYSVAEGAGSQDIVPTLVFDDGRFTYLRFPGNREIPAVFHVLGDGGETLVNARMEDDLLVVDRVSRRLMLRAGSAVVGLWNEAFDLDGRPPWRRHHGAGRAAGAQGRCSAATSAEARKGRHHDARPATSRATVGPDVGAEPAADGNTISPLPGEPGIPNVATRQRMAVSTKGLLAVVLLIGSLVAVAAFAIQRFSASGKSADEAESKLVKDKPTAATSEPRKLEMPPAPAASAAVATAPRIPALTPTADDLAEPIGVRRTGSGAPASGGPKVAPPEDAPILLVTTRPGATPSAGCLHPKG